ncbi:FMN reductase [Mycolicibacterium duvalii]|nr:NADPH-dependent FMN reductase [Mycolicibacterium duvalii]MCV7368184.1 NAD(P)H-dependent oxidoreductase [Mycolicibacterium duvalii]PEG43430.1 FMN reductase [Mycolicibacterium duvalii]
MVLLGSLREGSINRQLVETAVESAPTEVDLQLFDRIGELPFYNEDIDTQDAPEPVMALRAAAAEAAAALVATPEYNGTIPAVLKNAIDWLSRPWGNGALKGKPLVVVGVARGRYGGSWAHDETRKSFGIAGAKVLDEVRLSTPTEVLGGLHPRENRELATALRSVVEKLVVEAAERGLPPSR